jgi:hypothetical protein
MARRFIVLDAAFVRLVPAETHVELTLFITARTSLYRIRLNVPGIPVGAAKS